MLAIVDYGRGNLRSVQNGFRQIGVAAQVSGDPRNDCESRRCRVSRRWRNSATACRTLPPAAWTRRYGKSSGTASRCWPSAWACRPCCPRAKSSAPRQDWISWRVRCAASHSRHFTVRRATTLRGVNRRGWRPLCRSPRTSASKYPTWVGTSYTCIAPARSWTVCPSTCLYLLRALLLHHPGRARGGGRFHGLRGRVCLGAVA